MLIFLLQLDDIVHCKKAIQFLALTDESCKELLDNWMDIEEINKILKIPFEATNELQYKSLTMSDQFGCWLKMELKLEHMIVNENLKTDLAGTLVEKIFDRKKVLMANPALISAVYLDPRYKFELTETEVDIAKCFLSNLYKKITQTETKQVTQNCQPDQDDLFEQYLARSCSNIPVYEPDSGTSNSNLTREKLMHHDEFLIFLDKYDENPVRLKYKYSILQYWEENKHESPELYKLACILNAIAPTEVSVERAFSTLRFILTHTRTNLLPDMLQNILLINLNKDMVPKIHQEDLKQLFQVRK